MIRFVAPAIAILALSACSTAQVAQVQPIDGAISGQCHTDMVRGATGLAASPQTVERARVDSDSTEVRVVKGDHANGAANPSGEAMGPAPAGTGGSRLTIETGPTNNIGAIYCG